MAGSDSDKSKNFVSLTDIFKTFFRIGLFTLGGGLAMTPVMRYELVIRRRWVKDADFLSVMALATVVPGVIAVNVAHLLGRRLRGKSGSIAAILGTILPSFFAILLIAAFFLPFFKYPKVAAFFRGCAVAIVGQLAFVGFVFGRKLLLGWRQVSICALGLITVGILQSHPLWAIIIAGALGYVLCPEHETKGAGRRVNSD